MKACLSFDSGAERMGWASLREHQGRPYYHASGILALPHDTGKFQAYRLELINELIVSVPALIDLCEPDEIVTETVPAVGSFGGTQMYLANVACTVVQTIALQRNLPVYQIAARTVQSNIAIGRRPGKKVSKVMVRNGVIELLPELVQYKKKWVKVFDEPDAIAGGLAHLGFKVST